MTPTRQWQIWDRIRRGPCSAAQIAREWGLPTSTLNESFRHLALAGHIYLLEQVGRENHYKVRGAGPPQFGKDGRGLPKWARRMG